VIGYTLDTGALIALERRAQRAWGFLRAAREDQSLVTVPANVVAEWWRGRNDARVQILEALEVEVMDEELARRVGVALATVRGASLVDATVMVSAARRGDVVLTADIDDFKRLGARFPAVRVLRV
jgi:predicted nucleic acid-binding protein